MSPKLSFILCLTTLCMLALTACSQSRTPLAQLSATMASLPDLSGEDGIRPIPSRGAGPALTTAKHQLRDWIETELTSGDYRESPDIKADAFAAKINSDLKAAGIRTRPVQMWGATGVLVVVTSFDIVCGTDDSIYGWSWDGKAWRRAIEHEITDYTPDHYQPESFDGLEKVRFARVNAGSDARLYVLATAVNTWCSSGWLGRRFQLYDLDRTTAQAKLLIDSDVPANVLEGDRNASLSSNRMVIEFTGGDFEPRKMPFGKRASVFALDDGKVTPVPWAAADAEDFTEQWLSSPWPQSATVSAPGNPSLEKWHGRLHDLAGKPKTGTWSSFADAVRCRSDPDLWQYGIIFGTLKPHADLVATSNATKCRHVPGQPPDSCTMVTAPRLLDRLKEDFVHSSVVYFIVREISPNMFSMRNIREVPGPSCPVMGG